MSKRAIELIRVSTEGQAGEDRGSIPAQKAANRRTAAQNDLDIVRTIEITDVSGAAVLRSPEMQELLRLIESADIRGVVTKEFSRLMRPENFSDFVLLQAFADTGTILYLPDGPIDFSSKSGRLLGTLRAAIAGLERTEIQERVWAAKEEKRRAGKHPQSEITLPFGVGYDRERERWLYTDGAEKVLEAFRLFLSGETSYTEVGHSVGIEPFNLRIILRNPIYTGWRVIEKKRDLSASAIRVRAGGRQGDRPKILRTGDEIIRVKVLDPLVSESEFRRVQQILDLKKQNHWRFRPDHQRRFTYSGFLKCGLCGNRVYSHARRPREWYVCKSRTAQERKLRERKGLEPCKNPYMRRERLEARLDALFSKRLTDSGFLESLAAGVAERSRCNSRANEFRKFQRLQQRLRRKRERVLDSYYDGHIVRSDLERRLKSIDAECKFCEGRLEQIRPHEEVVTADELAKVFAPLCEWEFLPRNDKRMLLQSIVPEIHVENYEITKLGLLLSGHHRDEINHTGRDSSRRRA